MYSQSANQRIESLRAMLRNVKKIKDVDPVDLAALIRILRRRIVELEIQSTSARTHDEIAA